VPESAVRVVARDVGGSYGTRNSSYPEHALVAWAARRVGRPVKWTGTRLETFLTDYQSRDLVSRVELALDAQGTFLAFRGDKMIRMILVRERNRIVATAAIRNPRITENEVESIAGMRNVEEEVLRIIGTRRDWMQKYPIMHNLIRNPKAPVGLVVPLINRLVLRDLKGLKDDKGVSEPVRMAARKFYLVRTQKR